MLKVSNSNKNPNIYTYLTQPLRTITIKGRVIDNLTRRPLPLATVMIVNSYIRAITNRRGCYILRNIILPENAAIQVSKPGYRGRIINNFRTIYKSNTINFTLFR